MKDVKFLITNGINVQDALGLFGSIDKYDNVITVFYDTIEEKITQLNTVKGQGDLIKYRLLVHALKSEASYFGFAHFYDLAYKHEIAAKNNDMGYILEHDEELINEIRRVVSIVGQYLGKIEMTEIEGASSFQAITQKILVIDETELVVSLIHQIYGGRYEVLYANSNEAAIEKLNENLIKFREETKDIFLTPFKGLRKDKKYRRRLDYALARRLISEVVYWN